MFSVLIARELVSIKPINEWEVMFSVYTRGCRLIGELGALPAS